ncbi:phosphatase PAP2 family protein [Foetidibacter luteolus]|uniref:phosphatase PAP2 family protein n=1 Tax=Foetidibacter luteolus TaxID=2608880 RepID=UPI00129A2701|nr:phosphatase PAP2 family protein [Foetidibacter luteolus]
MTLLAATGLLEALKQWDTWLFLQINGEWTTPFLDSVFPWWRDQDSSLPLYLFLLCLVFINFGWRAWPWLLCAVVAVTLTDVVSSHWLKESIGRLRPCNDPVLSPYVRRLLGGCPGSGSFTSSHAANHFGQAAFYYFTLKPYIKKWGYLFFVWAATISYGQVYVGVHYPLDILGGAALGMFFGTSMAGLFNRRIGMPPLKKLTAETVV